MLSYRHAFHAGNHADILKHFVLIQILEYLGQKAAPYWYIDTHAGAGLYELKEGYATKNAEFETGIGRLINSNISSPELCDYLDLIRSFNDGNDLLFYPGSPLLAQRLLRCDDRAHLFELHPNDFMLLKNNMSAAGRQVKLYAADGLAGLKGLLPPQPRRGLILIDPSYERNEEYKTLVSAVELALVRFTTGIYVIWYPLLHKREQVRMIERLGSLAQRWLNITLQVKTPPHGGFGMYGSGLFILNPPWTLQAALEKTMPIICESLAQDRQAAYNISTAGCD